MLLKRDSDNNALHIFLDGPTMSRYIAIQIYICWSHIKTVLLRENVQSVESQHGALNTGVWVSQSSIFAGATSGRAHGFNVNSLFLIIGRDSIAQLSNVFFSFKPALNAEQKITDANGYRMAFVCIGGQYEKSRIKIFAHFCFLIRNTFIHDHFEISGYT